MDGNLINICLGKALPLVYALVGFCSLIVVHEFGHWIFCKLFGIHTPTFSIGMGPVLLQKKLGDTNFCLSAIPLGGYVEIAGLAEAGQGNQEHANLTGTTSFRHKPYWQKFLVLLGGIGFNFLFAYAAMITILMLGNPRPNVVIRTLEPGSLAVNAGFKLGDRITAIQKVDLAKEPELIGTEVEKLQKLEKIEQTFQVERTATPLILADEGKLFPLLKTLRDIKDDNGKFEVIHDKSTGKLMIGNTLPDSLAALVAKLKQTYHYQLEIGTPKKTSHTISVMLPPLRDENGKLIIRTKGRLGMGFYFPPSDIIDKYPLGVAITKGITSTNNWIRATLISFKMLVSSRSLQGVGGPVRIIAETYQSAKRGFSDLLFFLFIISINLAILNLLPLPIFDGGQWVVVTIESLLGREIRVEIRNVIHIVTWLMLLILVVVFTYHDILALIK